MSAYWVCFWCVQSGWADSPMSKSHPFFMLTILLFFSVFCFPSLWLLLLRILYPRSNSQQKTRVYLIYLSVCFSPLTLIPCAKFICENVRKKWSTKKNVQLNRFFFMCLSFYQSNLSWLFLMSIRFRIFKHIISSKEK